MRKTLLLLLLFAAMLGAMAATRSLVQPPPLREQNAAGEFDAVRAKTRLASVLGDQRPHPADTAADDAVRARIVGQLRQLGLQPIVRDQFACNELYKARGVSCARVRNVIAMLGPSTGKAVLLNAHYDSTPVGPGASDDGIGVATLLEIATILKDRPLNRPVMLLFNEGEELGLIGARAFLADPLSRNVDALINLEARGVRGPVNMFETSRPNGAALSVFARVVKNPAANSLSTDVYRLLPNLTDVTSFSDRGWLTLNLAPIGNETRYHSPGDDVAALDPATLQHMGDQTLALTKALAAGTPERSDGTAIFMDVGGRMLITLPLLVGAVLFVALLLGTGWVALRRGGLLRGAAVVAGSIVLSGLLAFVLLALAGAVRPGMFWRAEPIWTHLAVYASTMLVGAALVATAGAPLDRARLRPAFWFVFLVIGGMIGLVAPGGIIFFLFPPLIALAGLAASRWWRHAELVGALAAILFLYLTWGGMLGLLSELLNNGPMWVFAPLGALILLPALIEAKPLLGGARAPAAAAAGVLVLACWTVVLAVPAYSADRQQRFVIQQVTDSNTGKNWWSVLNDGAPLPKAFPGAWKRGKLPISDRERWLSPAFATAMSAPDVEQVSQVEAGNERTLTLRLQTNGNDYVSLTAPADARIRAAGIGGFVRPISGAEGKYAIGCFGGNCDGALLQVTIDKLRPVEFIIAGGMALRAPAVAPLLAAQSRFARPQYRRDEALAFRIRRL